MTSHMVGSPTEATLDGERVVLEPIVPAHADVLYDALQAPQLYTFIPHMPPLSKETLRERYTRWEARSSPDGAEVWLNYAVRDVSNASYVGTAQATIGAPCAETYIAYEVFPPFWRRGLARAACERLLGHLFANWAIDRVRALVDTRNVASWRLLESLRFRRIDLIPNADHFKGAPSDEFVYELGRPNSDTDTTT